MAFRLSLALSATVSLAALAAAGPAAAQQAGGTTQLEEIEVEGQGRGAGGGQGGGAEQAAAQSGAPGVVTNDGYVAKTTRTATKTDTPVHETPQTINTVTRKQLEDRQPQNLQEALAYTPGVRGGAFGFDPRFDSFFIRGVDVTYTGVFRDGLRQFNSPNGLFRLEPYGLESISILKGPASAIYGASSSAGIVDLISKRPTDYAFAEVEAQTGSFDRIQGNFDFGGPVNQEGAVLYRITGLARDAETELGKAVKDDRAFIAPSITFKPNDDTKLTVLAEFMDATTGGSAVYNNDYGPLFDKNGNPVLGDIDNDGDLEQLTGTIGANRNFGPDSRYNDFNQKQGRVGYEFEHAFSDRVSVHQNLRFSGLETNQEYSFFDDVGGYSSGLVKESNRALGVDTYLKAKLDTGPARHTVLAGVDFGHLRYTSRQGVGAYVPPGDAPGFDDPAISLKQRQRQTVTGVYLQDEIALDRWRLLIGGRHDWLDSTFGPNELIDAQRAKQEEGAFTGRAALSYVAPNGLTPYASYGTSFNANSGTVIDPDGAAGPLTGGVAKPTKGETAEAGVKYAIPGMNAAINGSVFWLKQVDGVIFDASSGLNRQVQADFRSRGVEIDATASLSNGVNLIATYAYIDTKILKLSDLAVGNEVSGIPKHAFTVWAGYDVKSGAARGLSVGAGVRYTGRNFGDDLNRPVIANKARAFVDAKASYELENLNQKLKGLRLQVSAQNLFDKVEQVCTAGYCYYDKGRQVIASLRYRW